MSNRESKAAKTQPALGCSMDSRPLVGSWPRPILAPSRVAGGWKCRRLALLAVASVAGLLGCQGIRAFQSGPVSVQLPAKHSVHSKETVILSDVKLSKDHPLVRDLNGLREQVISILDLAERGRVVVIYVFADQLKYRKYLDAVYPGLPPRRAYFVGTPDELAIYTFWGDRIQEDLRHEFTHGILHARLKNVPLWLDEGLAEYFEVVGPVPGTVNTASASGLATAIVNGWRPDMRRLESVNTVSSMQRIDYEESWAWVHLMLNGSPEAKLALMEMLSELETQERVVPLSVRLDRNQRDINSRFLNYVASLNTFRSWSPRTANDEHAATKATF